MIAGLLSHESRVVVGQLVAVERALGDWRDSAGQHAPAELRALMS